VVPTGIPAAPVPDVLDTRVARDIDAAEFAAFVSLVDAADAEDDAADALLDAADALLDAADALAEDLTE
jgi:hypothetical protein